MPHVLVYESMHDVLGPKILGQVQASLPTVWKYQAAIANFLMQTEDGDICKQLISSIAFYCLPTLVCCSMLAGIPIDAGTLRHFATAKAWANSLQL